ncbi:MAG: helix-turn-helix transcriptional regulator [Clostridia bacterium]|nr:helix-turn-helix transcriptional regulator [Clostridia bacterium]
MKENSILYRIFRLRLEAGFTQEELGKILGMSRVMYNKLENGKTILHVHHVIILSIFYGVTSDYILGLSDIRSVTT